MSLQVIAEKISVYEITGKNELGQPTAVDHIYERGQLIPDWVDSHQAFVLTNTGLAAEVGDHPDGSIRPLDKGPAPVLLPEHNPRVIPGSGTTGPLDVTEQVDETGVTSGRVAEDSNLPKLPADYASKGDWETYASEKLPAEFRMERSQAEGLKKPELVTEVKARYNDAKSVEAGDDDTVDETLSPKFN